MSAQASGTVTSPPMNIIAPYNTTLAPALCPGLADRPSNILGPQATIPALALSPCLPDSFTCSCNTAPQPQLCTCPQPIPGRCTCSCNMSVPRLKKAHKQQHGQSKRLDSDNQINLSRLIVSLAMEKAFQVPTQPPEKPMLAMRGVKRVRASLHLEHVQARQ
jgi:hypothetical protein